MESISIVTQREEVIPAEKHLRKDFVTYGEDLKSKSFVAHSRFSSLVSIRDFSTSLLYRNH